VLPHVGLWEAKNDYCLRRQFITTMFHGVSVDAVIPVETLERPVAEERRYV
jgi:hypothetical protein